MADLQQRVKKLADAPGIYRMFDAAGEVLYVGKARSLRKRVAQYFQKDYAHSTRTRKLMEKTADIQVTQTDSELEALLLENNLIKELRPRYNILMKDDKSYVYIEVDLAEDFPRLRVVREQTLQKLGRKPGARYFGPKLASSKVYETMRILKKLFPFRHCQLDIAWQGAKSSQEQAVENLALSPNKDLVKVTNRVIDFPCLDYFIKRCPGPCIGAVAPTEYKKIVQQIMDFLDGKSHVLEENITAEMNQAASQKLFEKAGRLRDKLFALQSITERQKISDPDRRDTDIIHFVTDLGHVYFNIFMIREGKLTGHENFVLDALELAQSDEPVDLTEILRSFLIQYYQKTNDVPKEILLPEILEDAPSLEQWLSQKRNGVVHLLAPQRGEKNKLLELSLKNALSFAKQHRLKWLAAQEKEAALPLLAKVLNLPAEKLKRIEGFDISHLGGNETVGSMVVFENGSAKSDHYRHFKMRTVMGKPDDYRSMEEVLMRRLKYLCKAENVRLRKASKAYIPQIITWGKSANWPEFEDTVDFKKFFLLLKNKQAVSMGRLVELEKGIWEISALFIAPEHRGEKLSFELLDRLIASVKNPRARFYVGVEPKLADHYLEFGFLPVREAPAVVQARRTELEKLDGKKYEVLAYYRKQKKARDPSFSAKPNLIVVDGGKGQLGVAVLVLKRLKLDIPVISLAKRLEEIYQPGQKAPLLLEEGDEALKLLQRIRDESHRFAVTFQRNLHRKNIFAE